MLAQVEDRWLMEIIKAASNRTLKTMEKLDKSTINPDILRRSSEEDFHTGKAEDKEQGRQKK